MPNAYGDLTTLKSAAFLNTPDDGHDERLLGMLETASRWIDGYCDRHFYVTEGERRFDGTGRVVLAVTDLVSAAEVRVRQGATGRWVGWNSGDWLAYPLNAAPTEPGGRPYTRIVATAGGRRFPLSRGGVIISGAWGYGDVREDTGLQVSGAEVATMADTHGHRCRFRRRACGALSAGHTVRIGDEQMYVTAVSDDGSGDDNARGAARGQRHHAGDARRGLGGVGVPLSIGGDRGVPAAGRRLVAGEAWGAFLAIGGRWSGRCGWHLPGGSRAAGTVSPAGRRPGGIGMTGIFQRRAQLRGGGGRRRGDAGPVAVGGTGRAAGPGVESTGRHRRERRRAPNGGGHRAGPGVHPVGPVGRHAGHRAGRRAVGHRRDGSGGGVRAGGQRAGTASRVGPVRVPVLPDQQRGRRAGAVRSAVPAGRAGGAGDVVTTHHCVSQRNKLDTRSLNSSTCRRRTSSSASWSATRFSRWVIRVS